jgi:putative Mn2+ efflux pump MntP
MQFIRDNKIYIAGILLALLGLWVYMTYFSDAGSDATLTADHGASPLPPDMR